MQGTGRPPPPLPSSTSIALSFSSLAAAGNTARTVLSSSGIQRSRAGPAAGVWKDLCQLSIWAGTCPQSLRAEEPCALNELGEGAQGAPGTQHVGRIHTLCAHSPRGPRIYVCRAGSQDLNRGYRFYPGTSSAVPKRVGNATHAGPLRVSPAHPAHCCQADTIDAAPGLCSARSLPTPRPLDPFPGTRKETSQSVSGFLSRPSALWKRAFLPSPPLLMPWGWIFCLPFTLAAASPHLLLLVSS